jgi:hypothetical protein
MQNRWRIIAGLNGERWQGLDMTQAESIMRTRGIKRKERSRILDGLMVMEAAALGVMNA